MNTRSIRILATIFFLRTLTLFAANPAEIWQRQQPVAPYGSNLLAYANGQFNLIGIPVDHPLRHRTTNSSWPWTLHTSIDGRQWNPQPIPTNWTNVIRWPQTLQSFGDDLVVGLYNGNTKGSLEWIHADGQREIFEDISPTAVREVTQFKGEFFAITYNWGLISTNLLRSKDGKVWTLVPGYERAYQVTSGNGSIVINMGTGFIARSEDGNTWETISVGTSNYIFRLKFEGGLYVGVCFNGEILTSSDGRQWSHFKVGVNNWYNVAYGDGRFCVVGSSGAAVSFDAVHWTQVPRSILNGNDTSQIAFGNGTWVFRNYNTATWLSHDALQWETLDTLVGTFRDLVYWKQTLVAGGGPLSTSPDVHTWMFRQPVDSTNCFFACNSSQILAACGVDSLLSTNGINWKSVSRPLNAVAFGNDRFAGIRNGVTFSTNGTTWPSEIPLPAGKPTAIAFGAGLFVIAASDGSIYTSANAVTFTLQASDITRVVRTLSFAHDHFMATGDRGLLLTSTDGLHWTKQNSGTTQALFRGTYGHGRFVIVGDGGTILHSVDGETWSDPITICEESLYSVAATDDRFVAVGNYGAVFTSAYFGPPRFIATEIASAENIFRFSVEGQIGTSQKLQSSSLNADGWVDELTFPQTTEIQTMSISLPSSTSRFYRLVKDP